MGRRRFIVREALIVLSWRRYSRVVFQRAADKRWHSHQAALESMQQKLPALLSKNNRELDPKWYLRNASGGRRKISPVRNFMNLPTAEMPTRRR